MPTTDILVKPVEPWILATNYPPDQIRSSVESAIIRGDLRMIFLQASAMTRWSDLYSEFERKFHLPPYFGRNLGALDECLADLSCLPGTPLAVLIGDSERMLAAEPAGDAATSLDLLRSAG